MNNVVQNFRKNGYDNKDLLASRADSKINCIKSFFSFTSLLCCSKFCFNFVYSLFEFVCRDQQHSPKSLKLVLCIPGTIYHRVAFRLHRVLETGFTHLQKSKVILLKYVTIVFKRNRNIMLLNVGHL